MKKVLVVGFTENLGGVERLIYSYYMKINRNMIQFDFLVNVENVPFRNEIEKLGGKFYVIPRKTQNFFAYKKGLHTFFKEHAKDYCTFWFNSNSLANLDYLVCAYKHGIEKRIVHSHNTMETRGRVYRLFHELNKQKVLKLATDYWACSEDAGKFFFGEGIIRSPQIRVINNAISLDEFAFDSEKRRNWRKKLGADDNTVLYGNIGRLSYQKNHEFLLESFHKLSSIQKKARLVLIGTGELENVIKEKIAALSLEDNVVLLGRQYDIPGILQALDVFVLPSYYEGLPIAAIEAQAAGLPCVLADTITRKVGLLECYYVSIQDADDWCDAMIVASQTKREYDAQAIKNAGYDIATEAQKLEEYLLS